MTGGDPPSLRPGSKGFCAEVNLRRLLPSIAVLSRWPPPAPVASGTVMIAAHSQAGESPLSPNGLREAHLCCGQGRTWSAPEHSLCGAPSQPRCEPGLSGARRLPQDSLAHRGPRLPRPSASDQVLT